MRRRFLRVAPLKTLTLLTQPVPPVAPATGGAGTPSNKPVYVPKCEAVLRGNHNQFTAILTDGLFPGDGLPKQIRQLFDDLPLHGIKGVVEFFGFEASLMFRGRGLAEGFDLLQQTPTAIGLESAPAPADGKGLTLLFRGKAKESPVFHEEAAPLLGRHCNQPLDQRGGGPPFSRGDGGEAR